MLFRRAFLVTCALTIGLNAFAKVEYQNELNIEQLGLLDVLNKPVSDGIPVKVAGVYFLSVHNSTAFLLMGKLVKVDPNKADTHMFHQTYGSLSGKAEAGESPLDTAVREAWEETAGHLGTPDTIRETLLSDDTLFVKNSSWANFRVLNYIKQIPMGDLTTRYNSSEQRSKEISRLDWISIISIFNAAQKLDDKGTSWLDRQNKMKVEKDEIFARFKPKKNEINQSALTPDDKKAALALVEKEIATEIRKYEEANPRENLTGALTHEGTEITIADYVARTILLEGSTRAMFEKAIKSAWFE